MRSPRFCARYFALLAGGLAAGVSLAAASRTRTPLRIEQTVEPQFPPALAQSVITQGTTSVIIQVDATGTLLDWLVINYSHPAFAAEVAAVLPLWRYQPERIDGQAVGVRQRLNFFFSASGRVVSLNAQSTVEALLGTFAHDSAALVSPAQELDAPLQVLASAAPRHPGFPDKDSPGSGLVTLDFFVDAQGQPRLPMVFSSSHDVYAEAAIAALDQWRFSIPKRRGKPTTTHVRQQFVFDQKPSA